MRQASAAPALLAAMPELELVPTGGISLGEVPEWLNAGAFAVGVGSDLTAAPDLAVRLRAFASRLA